MLQITPFLGMLRQIQGHHEEIRAANRKAMQDPSAHSCPRLPKQVNLVWAVRHRDELQLLDADLLTTAA